MGPTFQPSRIRRRLDEQPPAVGFLLVVLPLLLLYLVSSTLNPRVFNDTAAAATPAHQFAWHGNFTLDEYRGQNPWFVEAGDRVVSNRFPGAVYLAIPFYRLLGDPGRLTMAPAYVAAALVTALAMGLLYLVLRRLVPASAAFVGAVVAGTATSTWGVSATGLWTHGPNQLWLAAALLATAAGHHIRSGLAFGAAILTRPQTAIIPAAVGLIRSWQDRSVRPVLGVGLASSAGLALLLLYNRLMFPVDGADLPSAVGGGHGAQPVTRLWRLDIADYLENVAGTLVSPSRGLLLLSPFLLLLVPGLRAAWRNGPPWVRASAIGGVLYLLVQLRVNHFYGGNDLFVYRLPIEALTMAAPLLVLAYRRWTALRDWRRDAFWLLVAVSVAVQVVAALVFRRGAQLPGRVDWSLREWDHALGLLGWGGMVLVVVGVAAAFTLYRGARAPVGRDASATRRCVPKRS